MPRSPSVPVHIYDQVYHLACDQSDAQAIERAAAFLDKKMREAAAVAGERAPLDIAILAAMGVAEGLIKEKRKRTDLVEDADRRWRYFASRLEDQGGAVPPATPRF